MPNKPGILGVKKILFRADTKPFIGSGDLVSLIHLAKVFAKNGWEVYFIIRDYDGGKDLMVDYGIERYLAIPNALPVDKEVEVINDFLRQNQIDHFFACITERLLTDYTGLNPDVVKGCVNFDGIIPDSWQLVVNWNFPKPDLYKKELFPDTAFLLGPEFVILPGNFDPETIKKRVFKKTIRKLLIAMGGRDEYNLTTGVVQKIVDEALNFDLTIILGPSFDDNDRLNAVLKASRLSYECKRGVTDMFSEYMNCDAAIGTGGLTSSELVATHTPALLIAAYDHQITRCRYFHEQGMAVFLGDKKEYNSENLRKRLSELEGFNAANFPDRFYGGQAIFESFSRLSQEKIK